MRHGTLRFDVALLLVLALAASCAVRAPKSNGMDHELVVEGHSLGIHEVRGEVVRVDPTKRTILVRNREDEREIEIRVVESTPVFFEGGVASFGEITEGSPVRAAYSIEGPEKIASWVEVPRPDPNARPPREPLEPAGEEAETEPAPADRPIGLP
jgi:hypothetical protein